jgi:NTE family protein
MRAPWKFKVGLALGGGAARGLAHLGVLRALVRAGIPIDVIVGTSMGAIIGGAYAATRDIEELERKVRIRLDSEEFKKTKVKFLKESKQQRGGLLFSVANLVRKGIFYGVSSMRPSFLSAEAFATSFETILPEEPIESLPIRFGAVALDIESGHEVVICSGDLHHAAKASSAIPGILPPVKLNGRTLIDGGWVDKIPVMPAFLLGADLVIAVDITAGLEGVPNLTRGVDIMVRADAIKDSTLVSHLRRLADLIVTPDVKSVHWADFGAYDRCIAAGDEAAQKAVPQIKSMLRRERILSILRPGPGKKMARLHHGTGESEIYLE